MNVIRAIQDYIIRMLDNVKGMKVILMDSDTMGIVSMVFSQSDVLQKEVYLFDLISTANREQMTHLKALVFVRPTEENIEFLCAELKNPKYCQYHLFFSNIISQKNLEEVAKADENEVVQQVQEFFADYFAVTKDTFSLNISSCVSVTPKEQQELINKICDGLSSVLLSLKRKPIIRYENNSSLSQKVAQEIARRMQAERVLFDTNNRRGTPLLLILDRRSDPVTPLLMQWTYQAMVHELLGLKNNRVMMKEKDDKKPPEIVLSTEQDEFYAKNIHSNFGDLALNIQQRVGDLQKHAKVNTSIKDIEDMKRFIQGYPEYQKMTGSVSKHLSLLEELSRKVGERSLLEVSEIEQNIACQNEHSDAVRAVTEILQNHKVKSIDKLKIVLLYALKYEKQSNNNLPRFLQMLSSTSDLDQHDISTLLKTLIRTSGADSRTGDLFGNKNFFARAKREFKKGLQGAVNVYTQHKPLLAEQIDSIVKGRLNDIDFPLMGGNNQNGGPISDVIIFYVGGTTFEEALVVSEFNDASSQNNNNNANSNISLILGGTTVHNSMSYLNELRKIRDSMPF